MGTVTDEVPRGHVPSRGHKLDASPEQVGSSEGAAVIKTPSGGYVRPLLSGSVLKRQKGRKEKPQIFS